MNTLVFLACLMSSPQTCREVEVLRPPDEPAMMCLRTAIRIMAQWRAVHGEGWFVRSWRCVRGERAA